MLYLKSYKCATSHENTYLASISSEQKNVPASDNIPAGKALMTFLASSIYGN